MPRSSRFRSCPLCEAICGLDLQFEDGKMVAIKGDAADPFSRGHVCPKGNAILDLESDPDRLRRPQLRDGKGWREIGWDEAFDLAGQRLAAVQAEHGGDAVAAYLGNPNVHHLGHLAYLPSLLRLLKTRNVYSASSVDQWPHQWVAWAMYGHQFLLPIADIDRTDFLLLLGANPVASNGSLMTATGIADRLKALAKRGRLVVVDPRRTETAALANEHLAIRPGTDAWLLVALLQALLRRSAPRVAAIGDRINGLDEALAAISAVETCAVETITGISGERIDTLAEQLLAAPSAVAFGRMGLSTQAYGTLCQWLLQLINLVTGNLDRAGGALPNEPVIPVTGPGTSAGHYERWRSRVRGLPEFAGELPVAALAEEIATPGAGQVRALVTCAGNPVVSTPNGRALAGQLDGLDFMLSIDIYRNETTRHAHLILPPSSFLSQDHYDLIFNSFAVRRVARLSTPVLPQPEDERADWQIFNGVTAAYARHAGREFQPLPPPRTLVAMGLARGGSGLSLADLEAAPHGLDLGPLEPSLLRRLQTASGKIECVHPVLLAELEHLAAARSAPTEVAAGEATTLQLIGRRDLRNNNSWMHNAQRLIKGKPRHHLYVHPDDLAARGIADGERVRLSSRVGSIETEVEADADLLRGVVCLPHGYGHDLDGVQLTRARQVVGASYNDLSDPERLDRPSGNAALNGLPVHLSKL